MSSTNWELVTVREVTNRVTKGTTPTTLGSRFKTEGINFIKVETISESGTLIQSKLAYIDEETHEKLARSVIESGDLLFSIAGTIGRVARVHDTNLPANTNQAVAIIRPNLGRIDRDFLYYCLRDVHRVARARTRVVQSVQQNLSLAEVGNIELPLPPIDEQRAIAATLGALDDKIESNRRAIAKLDELFHAMWRREYGGLPVETEAPLSEHVTTQYGLTASASSDADGDKFLRVTDINKQNWIDWTRVPFAPTDDTSRAKYSLSKGDLLVARMADPGKSAIYDGGPTAVFASYLVRLKPSSYEEALFIYGFLKSSEYLDYATGAMTGSVQKNMNAKVIVAASLRWPDSSTVSRFAEHAGPLRDKIAQIVEESSRLSTLRDALLSELLSGRIRTGDLEVAS